MTAEQLKALIVDDDEEWREEILRPELEKHFVVHTAADYRSAIRELEENFFALVTVDMRFEKDRVGPSPYGGTRLLRHIREHYAGTQCIVISALTGVELTPARVANLVLKYDLIGYIEKTRFDYDELERLIDEAISARSASTGENVPLSASQRRRLAQRQDELQRPLATYNCRIKALHSDIARELDGERRAALEERLDEARKARERIQAELEDIERQLGRE